MASIDVLVKEGRFSYYEHPVYAVANALWERGYTILNETAYPVNEPSKNIVGIARPPAKGKGKNVVHLGYLKLPKGSEDERWVMEVHGRENLTEITDLLSDIVPEKIKIHIVLARQSLEMINIG